MTMINCCRVLVACLMLLTDGVTCQRVDPSSGAPSRASRTTCSNGDCHPETGDLLIGRTKFLHASSTCGLKQPERYCVLGQTQDATKCFVCDSSEPFDARTNINSHTVDNIVSRQPGDRFSRWWQSENGRQDVYLQFDLEAEFTFTHIIMTFKTFRPAAMSIEKSSNYGRTWKPYAYFAYNCADSYPGVSTKAASRLGEVYCESKYSSETPSTKGEIIYRVLPPTLVQSKDPYSSEIQDLLKITNLRVNFTKLHTFGDNLLDIRDEIKEKYYYAMYEMVVRGSCLCYGHASRCIEVQGVQYDVTDTQGMVHGQCECTHNTAGTNCEQCLPLYNDVKWKPARNGQRNECKKCRCNNHALKCEFNETLFVESGGLSGGVCLNCEHNTMGRHCELCKDNHYRDPNRPIDDLFTCRPCQCFADGSLNDAKCDPRTDKEAGLVSGRCYCKTHVEGDKCDVCQNGYFNLTKDNVDGCEPCSCNLIGTAGNLGCDKKNGLCSCKANVAGRACDQCRPGFYGLSADDPNGCRPCDCAVGGAVNSTCDAITGQCYCRPNMIGRRCDRPSSGYFCPAISHLVYDAESANKLDQRSQDVYKQIYSDRQVSWTGPGYVKVSDGAILEFVVDNIPSAGLYEIAIRYEQQQQQSESLEQQHVRIVLTRDDGFNGPVDLSGPCAKAYNLSDEKQTSLPYNALYHVVQPASCLEPNRRYTIRLELLSQSTTSNNVSTTSQRALILIDSIVLVPVVESLDIFKMGHNERLLAEYRHYNCRDVQLNPYKYKYNDDDICAKYACTIGIAAIAALPCKCDPTGSLSNICDETGGQCKCKPNVVGRQCDQCAPSTWGFGPNGCQACNCNSGGAKNNLCNVDTGVCDCFDNVHGAKCDECMVNHWQFPSCIECNCNGNADNCDQKTGKCINCKDHTTGFYCDRCEDGFYVQPMYVAGQLTCKECMCPGGSTGNKFANTCYYDPRFDSIMCNCNEGYVGAKCEKCAINYYGNPLEMGGACRKCECNNNIDPTDPASCNQDTGTCNNCLYNTDGNNCEYCKDGFFGNASNHECQPCSCYPDGTQGNSYTNCDRNTGQCRCLPNVVGKYCDQCKADHYGLASGTGCVECDCDVDGTHDGRTSCDLATGQCQCLQSRGGRTCSECSYGYWGDPNEVCKRCECSVTGSKSEQCDRLSGACDCRKGIAGYNCDRCDRGTFGEIPFCSQCGECFDDWSSILNGIKRDLDELEDKASNLAVAASSTVKDFMSQYAAIEDKLNDIKKIMASNGFTDRQLKSIADSVANIEKQIAQKKESKKKFYNIEAWNEDNPAMQLERARDEYLSHKLEADELKKEVLRIKESTSGGAIESILDSDKATNQASKTIDKTKDKVNKDFASLVDHIDRFLTGDDAQNVFNTSEKINGQTQQALKVLSNAHVILSGLNMEVCGAATSENEICHGKCGGAGCNGKCGTNSSSCAGLVDSYWHLVELRQQFDTVYGQQENAFKRLLTKWRNSTNVLAFTNREMQGLVERANQSLMLIDSKRKQLDELTSTIKEFIEKNANLPKQIEQDSNYVIDKDHQANEAELDELLKKIAQLSANIDLEPLKNEADGIRTQAQSLLNNVTHASLYLPGIQANMNLTQTSIETNANKIREIEESVQGISQTNRFLEKQYNESREHVDSSKAKLDDIEKSIDDLRAILDYDQNNDRSLNLAKHESLKAKIKESSVSLDRTKHNLALLESKLNEITNKLQTLHNENTDNADSDALITLINLQSSITAKKVLLEQRLAKLKEDQRKTKSVQ